MHVCVHVYMHVCVCTPSPPPSSPPPTDSTRSKLSSKRSRGGRERRRDSVAAAAAAVVLHGLVEREMIRDADSDADDDDGYNKAAANPDSIDDTTGITNNDIPQLHRSTATMLLKAKLGCMMAAAKQRNNVRCLKWSTKKGIEGVVCCN